MLIRLIFFVLLYIEVYSLFIMKEDGNVNDLINIKSPLNGKKIKNLILNSSSNDLKLSLISVISSKLAKVIIHNKNNANKSVTVDEFYSIRIPNLTIQ